MNINLSIAEKILYTYSPWPSHYYYFCYDADDFSRIGTFDSFRHSRVRVYNHLQLMKRYV